MLGKNFVLVLVRMQKEGEGLTPNSEGSDVNVLHNTHRKYGKGLTGVREEGVVCWMEKVVKKRPLFSGNFGWWETEDREGGNRVSLANIGVPISPSPGMPLGGGSVR